MKLTPQTKKVIDGKTYRELLEGWRFLPSWNRWFEGETGEYWAERMKKLRDEGADHTAISKEIGWKA